MSLDDNNQPHQDPESSPEPRPEPLTVASAPELMEPPAAASHSEQPFWPARRGLLDPALPEDLRVPWGWLDLLFLVIFAIVGTFVLSILVVAGFALLGVNLHQLQSSVQYKSLLLIINQALLSVVLLVYLSTQLRLGFRAPFWRTIGWRPLQTGQTPRSAAYLGLILSGFLLAILVSLGSSAFHTKTQLPIEQFFQDRLSALLLMSLGVLLAPVLEETVFRGYIYPVAARSFGVTGGILFTGTIFGLLHASQLWGGWGQIALLVVVGIVFTYARAATHTVVASYLMHVSYNSFLFLALAIGSHGFRHFPGSAIIF
jgi:membrane protease YdiL (CAAX protease family)